MGTSSEATVDEGGGTTIPAEIRESLDIDAGDRIRWEVTDEGALTVEVVKQETGVFEDFEPASMGGDGSTAHDTTGAER